MADITRILQDLQAGDPAAAEELLAMVYSELHQVAAAKIAREKLGQSLEAGDLVHEAYLRLVGLLAPADRPAVNAVNFADRRHFYAVAAEAMRRVLIDRARKKASLKHGGGGRRVPLTDVATLADSPDGLLAVDEALTRLAQEHPQKAELVKLRFFGGLTMPDAATALGISLATAERWWAFAKSWLFAELSENP